MRDELARGLGEIAKHEGLARDAAVRLGLLALAREDEDRLRADGVGGLQVLETISHDRHALQLRVEAHGYLLEHPGTRLAAAAFLDRGMRAEEERVDAA